MPAASGCASAGPNRKPASASSLPQAHCLQKLSSIASHLVAAADVGEVIGGRRGQGRIQGHHNGAGGGVGELVGKDVASAREPEIARAVEDIVLRVIEVDRHESTGRGTGARLDAVGALDVGAGMCSGAGRSEE